MPTYFFDSSSLVKRYTKETGTAWVMNIFKPVKANPIYVARITFVEVISALSRKVRGGQINSSSEIKAVGRFRRAFHGKFRIVEISPNLTEHATQLARKHFCAVTMPFNLPPLWKSIKKETCSDCRL